MVSNTTCFVFCFYFASYGSEYRTFQEIALGPGRYHPEEHAGKLGCVAPVATLGKSELECVAGLGHPRAPLSHKKEFVY